MSQTKQECLTEGLAAIWMTDSIILPLVHVMAMVGCTFACLVDFLKARVFAQQGKWVKVSTDEMHLFSEQKFIQQRPVKDITLSEAEVYLTKASFVKGKADGRSF